MKSDSSDTSIDSSSKGEKQSKRKPRSLEFYQHLANTINGRYPAEIFPPFPGKFYVLKDQDGARRIIEDTGNGVIRHVIKDKVIDALTGYIESNPGLADSSLTIREYDDTVLYWMRATKAFQHPIAPVLQLTEPGYTYHRLPFDFSQTATECPCWDEILSRMSNSSQFMAWVGSLFDPHADRQQYVWMFGEGRNGKSSIGRFLARCLVGSSTWEQVPGKGDRFWGSTLVGKRLVIFGDCNNYAFPMSGMFKTLTGGDQIRIEQKFQGVFSIVLYCKFLFFSNEKPMLESKEADMRRVIFCELQAITRDFGFDYEDKLWGEAPSFLRACWQEYLRLAGPGKPIPCDKEELESLVSLAEDGYQSFFEINFIPDRASCLRASEMARLMKASGYTSSHEQRKIKDWMEKNYGVVRTRVTQEKIVIYRGIRAKFG